MNLSDVMDQVAAQLDTIAGLRVFAYPPGEVTPPAAVVAYPTDYRYDETYGRGMDRLTLTVVVVIGVPTERQTRDLLAKYVHGTGSDSVKAVLESAAYSAFHTLRVTGVEFDVYELGATKYMAALFDCDIAGQGSA